MSFRAVRRSAKVIGQRKQANVDKQRDLLNARPRTDSESESVVLAHTSCTRIFDKLTVSVAARSIGLRMRNSLIKCIVGSDEIIILIIMS